MKKASSYRPPPPSSSSLSSSSSSPSLSSSSSSSEDEYNDGKPSLYNDGFDAVTSEGFGQSGSTSNAGVLMLPMSTTTVLINNSGGNVDTVSSSKEGGKLVKKAKKEDKKKAKKKDKKKERRGKKEKKRKSSKRNRKDEKKERDKPELDESRKRKRLPSPSPALICRNRNTSSPPLFSSWLCSPPQSVSLPSLIARKNVDMSSSASSVRALISSRPSDPIGYVLLSCIGDDGGLWSDRTLSVLSKGIERCCTNDNGLMEGGSGRILYSRILNEHIRWGNRGKHLTLSSSSDADDNDHSPNRTDEIRLFGNEGVAGWWGRVRRSRGAGGGGGAIDGLLPPTVTGGNMGVGLPPTLSTTLSTTLSAPYAPAPVGLPPVLPPMYNHGLPIANVNTGLGMGRGVSNLPSWMTAPPPEQAPPPRAPTMSSPPPQKDIHNNRWTMQDRDMLTTIVSTSVLGGASVGRIFSSGDDDGGANFRVKGGTWWNILRPDRTNQSPGPRALEYLLWNLCRLGWSERVTAGVEGVLVGVWKGGRGVGGVEGVKEWWEGREAGRGTGNKDVNRGGKKNGGGDDEDEEVFDDDVGYDDSEGESEGDDDGKEVSFVIDTTGDVSDDSDSGGIGGDGDDNGDDNVDDDNDSDNNDDDNNDDNNAPPTPIPRTKTIEYNDKTQTASHLRVLHSIVPEGKRGTSAATTAAGKKGAETMWNTYSLDDEHLLRARSLLGDGEILFRIPIGLEDVESEEDVNNCVMWEDIDRLFSAILPPTSPLLPVLDNQCLICMFSHFGVSYPRSAPPSLPLSRAGFSLDDDVYEDEYVTFLPSLLQDNEKYRVEYLLEIFRNCQLWREYASLVLLSTKTGGKPTAKEVIKQILNLSNGEVGTDVYVEVGRRSVIDSANTDSDDGKKRNDEGVKILKKMAREFSLLKTAPNEAGGEAGWGVRRKDELSYLEAGCLLLESSSSEREDVACCVVEGWCGVVFSNHDSDGGGTDERNRTEFCVGVLRSYLRTYSHRNDEESFGGLFEPMNIRYYLLVLLSVLEGKGRLVSDIATEFVDDIGAHDGEDGEAEGEGETEGEYVRRRAWMFDVRECRRGLELKKKDKDSKKKKKKRNYEKEDGRNLTALTAVAKRYVDDHYLPEVEEVVERRMRMWESRDCGDDTTVPSWNKSTLGPPVPLPILRFHLTFAGADAVVDTTKRMTRKHRMGGKVGTDEVREVCGWLGRVWDALRVGDGVGVGVGVGGDACTDNNNKAKKAKRKKLAKRFRRVVENFARVGPGRGEEGVWELLILMESPVSAGLSDVASSWSSSPPPLPVQTRLKKVVRDMIAWNHTSRHVRLSALTLCRGLFSEEEGRRMWRQMEEGVDMKV